MLLIRFTNTGTAVGTGNNQVPTGVHYIGFSQGAVSTDSAGRITGARITNGANLNSIPQTATMIIEVGVLTNSGNFSRHLTSRA